MLQVVNWLYLLRSAWTQFWPGKGRNLTDCMEHSITCLNKGQVQLLYIPFFHCFFQNKIAYSHNTILILFYQQAWGPYGDTEPTKCWGDCVVAATREIWVLTWWNFNFVTHPGCELDNHYLTDKLCSVKLFSFLRHTDLKQMQSSETSVYLIIKSNYPARSCLDSRSLYHFAHSFPYRQFWNGSPSWWL